MGNLFNKDRIRHFLHFNLWIVLVDIAAFSLSYLLTLYIRFIVNTKPTGEVLCGRFDIWSEN